MRDRLFLLSGILGVGVLTMTLLLSIIGPREVGPMPHGFITPVMAFEFVKSEAELRLLFEPDGSAAAMDRVNRWDFLFMSVYGLFLSAFALAVARRTGQRYYYVPAALALLIPLADAMENVQLLAITIILSEDDVAPILGQLLPLLTRLQLFTWLKWGGLVVYFLLIWPYFRGRSGLLGRVTGIVAQLPAVLAVLAYLSRGLLSELLALSIGAAFLLLTVYSWRQALPEVLETGFFRKNPVSS